MTVPILAGDQLFLDAGVGHVLRQGEQTSTITDAMVAASATNAALRVLVSAAASSTETQPYKELVNRALVLGFNDGSQSDANINAASTVAALVANTVSQAGKVGPLSEFL